jgi:putative FmdB family regulatory protein
MPLYEYFCDKCDDVFEALRPISRSEEPAPCPGCRSQAVRILPTTFSARKMDRGYNQRVPFHHKPIRNVDNTKRQIAPVKAKSKKRAKAAKR